MNGILNPVTLQKLVRVFIFASAFVLVINCFQGISKQIATPVFAAPLAQQAEGKVINTSALNVRSGPGTNYSSVGTVNQADTLQILSRNQDCTWLYITSKQISGWVASSYVAKTLSCDSLPFGNPSSMQQKLNESQPESDPSATLKPGSKIDCRITDKKKEALALMGISSSFVNYGAQSIWIMVKTPHPELVNSERSDPCEWDTVEWDQKDGFLPDNWDIDVIWVRCHNNENDCKNNIRPFKVGICQNCKVSKQGEEFFLTGDSLCNKDCGWVPYPWPNGWEKNIPKKSIAYDLNINNWTCNTGIIGGSSSLVGYTDKKNCIVNKNPPPESTPPQSTCLAGQSNDPGLLDDFERGWCWKRADQNWGDFTLSRACYALDEKRRTTFLSMRMAKAKKCKPAKVSASLS